MNVRILIMSAAMALTTGAVWAKLPPPSEEAKAKAAEAKAKADDAAKKDAELLTRAQERAVANFKRNRGAMSGKK